MVDIRPALTAHSSADDIRAAVAAWVETHVPRVWREAAHAGGRSAIRAVRTRADYEAWYPAFAASGMVVANWPVDYGGLGLDVAQARVVDAVLAPYNLGRLNVLGLNSAAPALFAHGTEEQRLRFLPPIVRNEEIWCQLLSEPGAGSDLASLATRAVRDGDEWVLDGQKVWTTWAHFAHFALCLARTDPGVSKRRGITYFLVDLRTPGVHVRPLRHLGGEIDFNEVFLDGVRVPDGCRVGAVGDGWRVAGSTLAGERQMVSGSGGAGVGRIGGSGIERVLERAVALGRHTEPAIRQGLAQLWGEQRIRDWTNDRVRARGRDSGALSSIGKIHNASLNQRIQLLATELLGADALAWNASDDGTGPEAWAASMPFEVHGMLRSRANTIEGGTSEVNRNVVGEKILGLPREPDPWTDVPWEQVPRS